jgi:hypothetical protein
MMQECSANLGKIFPRGSSWDLPDDRKVVELTPSTMKEYFTSNKNALNTPFIIRGFLNQPDTDFDLNKYADIHYVIENLQSNNTYIFDISGKVCRQTLSYSILFILTSTRQLLSDAPAHVYEVSLRRNACRRWPLHEV